MIRRILLPLAVLCFCATIARAESPAVLFVFDASGSMNAKMQGRTKLDIARSVMSDLVTSLEPGVQVGLVAYGHRRKNDCKDIEVVVPVGGDRAAVSKAVRALAAKGETPISESVRMAAAELRSHEGETSVVVVSDGKETCGGDPCAAAHEAVAAGVHLRIHVVGFDVTPEEAKQLQCVAKEGKGRYVNATNASELTKALAEVTKEVAPTPAPAPKPTTAPPAAKRGLKLHAVLAAGKPRIEKDLTWEVLPGTADIEGDAKKIETSYDAAPSFDLPAGTYRVRVTRGDTKREVNVEIKEGEAVDREVVLDAGRVKATARLSADSPPIDKELTWTVLGEQGLEGEKKTASTSYDAAPVFTLPAGHYTVRVERGSAKSEKPVDVVAGEDQAIELIAGAGRLKMSALFATGGQAITKDVSWSVYDDKQSLEGRGNAIANSYDAAPIFTLPAGKYTVVCKRGDAEAETSVEVRAGEDQRQEIALGAGILQVKAVVAAGGAAITSDITWEIQAGAEDLEGERKNLATSYDAAPSFTLKAGKYHVEATHAQRRGGADVEVKPGEKTTIDVVLDQAK